MREGDGKKLYWKEHKTLFGALIEAINLSLRYTTEYIYTHFFFVFEREKK